MTVSFRLSSDSIPKLDAQRRRIGQRRGHGSQGCPRTYKIFVQCDHSLKTSLCASRPRTYAPLALDDCDHELEFCERTLKKYFWSAPQKLDPPEPVDLLLKRRSSKGRKEYRLWKECCLSITLLFIYC